MLLLKIPHTKSGCGRDTEREKIVILIKISCLDMRNLNWKWDTGMKNQAWHLVICVVQFVHMVHPSTPELIRGWHRTSARSDQQGWENYLDKDYGCTWNRVTPWAAGTFIIHNLTRSCRSPTHGNSRWFWRVLLGISLWRMTSRDYPQWFLLQIQ